MLRIVSPFDHCNYAHSSNYLSYFNMSNPGTSGMLRFVTDDLQDTEDDGDRGLSSLDLFQSGSLNALSFSAARMVLTV